MKLIKELTLYFFIPIVLFYLATKISKSNAGYVYYVQTPEHDGGDLLAIAKLNDLVACNFLDREYYEGVAYTDISMRWFANYNKKQEALLISGDPMSGWSYFYYATPQQLRMISEKKIPAAELGKFLKPFPSKLLGDCPTRSRDLFSIF